MGEIHQISQTLTESPPTPPSYTRLKKLSGQQLLRSILETPAGCPRITRMLTKAIVLFVESFRDASVVISVMLLLSEQSILAAPH
jgi:hypothetical protein